MAAQAPARVPDAEDLSIQAFLLAVETAISTLPEVDKLFGRPPNYTLAQFTGIGRINAASREAGVSYSRLMSAMRASGVDLDRKVLADIAVRDPKAFRQYIDLVKDKPTKASS